MDFQPVLNKRFSLSRLFGGNFIVGIFGGKTLARTNAPNET